MFHCLHILQIRWTREFGMVITVELGGTDTEFYAEGLHLGQAVVSASMSHVSLEEFLAHRGLV